MYDAHWWFLTLTINCVYNSFSTSDFCRNVMQKSALISFDLMQNHRFVCQKKKLQLCCIMIWSDVKNLKSRQISKFSMQSMCLSLRFANAIFVWVISTQKIEYIIFSFDYLHYKMRKLHWQNIASCNFFSLLSNIKEWITSLKFSKMIR